MLLKISNHFKISNKFTVIFKNQGVACPIHHIGIR